MSSELIIGLRIGVIGLGITFLALGFLLIMMRLLLRVFPVQKEKPHFEAVPIAEKDSEQQLEEMAVALAVGICLLERVGVLGYKDPSLGKLLEKK